MHTGLGCLYRVVLIVNRAGGASQIKDLVHLYVERKCNVMTQKLKPRVVVQMVNVSLGAGKEVVDAQDFMAIQQQPVTKMRSQKTGSTCDKNTFNH